LIITLSLQANSLWQATSLGLAYSAGLAIPFLVAALGIGWVTTILRRYSKVMRYTEIVMGVLMVIVGIMLMFGVFNILATMFPGWNPEI
jgi:cytochrome c-type biogenesis protein